MSRSDDAHQVGSHEWIMAKAEEFEAAGETEPRLARDPVNQPMINNWTEAIGDTSPLYADTDEARARHGGPVAPTAMAQVWTMYGLDPTRPAHDPLHGTMAMLDEAGYTSVLGTNCDQTYARYLRPGEQVAISTRLESVVGPKRTGVGEGYFVTTENIWRVGDEEVATMTFRVLKFKPGTAPKRAPAVDRTKTVRPVVNADNAFFFEGTRLGEVRIQQCNACGELRMPPGPTCPSCLTFDRGYVVASGKGRVFSFTEIHAPAIPGKEMPFVVALIELAEGVRMLGEVALGGPDGPDAETETGMAGLAVGDPVRATFTTIDEDLTLVAWEADR